MGAYLTQPITEKISEDNAFKGMTYGASCMQGWRITQEDAHNCITDFDTETDTSLFAVYDGHGGSEVAQYSALNLPDFIKKLPEYETGDLGNCSKAAFINFDATLADEIVIKELKILAGDDDGGDEDESSATPCVKSEAEMLQAEADMPLDQLLSKYENLPPGLQVKNLCNSEQMCSPMLRGKKTIFNGEEEAGGSSNCVSSSDSNNSNNSSIAISLDDKLLTNGHADNENNLNKEKEIQDSLNSKNEINSASQDGIKCEDSEPSSSTDKINSPVNKITSESDCSSTVGNSEENYKSPKASLSSVASSSVGSSFNAKSSEVGGSGSCNSNSEVTAATSSGVGSSQSSQLESSTGCISSSFSASSSSAGVSGGSASSSSDVGNSAPGSSTDSGAGPSCSSSSSEAGSSGASGEKTKGTILDMDDDDSGNDEEDDDEEYEDMDSDEEEEDEEEEEEDEAEENIEHPYMDMTNEEPGSDSGCTACLALLRGKQLIVANAGDSRCVLSRDGIAVELSLDHKPEDEVEKKRIEKAGGKVTADGRVNGGLNLSRALGDHWYKRNGDLPAEEQMISPSPDVQSVTLEDTDDFIVIACDGIWNYLSSQEVVDYVRERLKSEEKRKKPSLICEEMFDYCLAPNTFGDGTGCDNMTCIIIVLNPDREPRNLDRKRTTEEMDSSLTDDIQIKKKTKVDEVINSCNDTDKETLDDGETVSSESN